MMKNRNISFGKSVAVLLLWGAGLFILPPVQAQKTVPHMADDSLVVFHYPLGIRMFKTKYAENSRSLQSLRERLRAFQKGEDTLYVNGYCGSGDTGATNRRIAFWRSNNLKGYLINTLGLRERDFKTVNHTSAHPAWGEVVTLGFSPTAPAYVFKDSISPVPEAETPADEKKETPEIAETEKEVTVKETATPVVSPESGEAESLRPQAEQATAATGIAPSSSGRYLGVKTNIAAWAGTIMNIAADVQVSEHFSIELPILWCPWHVSSKHAVKTFAIQPEARYWLSKPGEGHFFGVHAHVGWFNVKWNRDRYQDTDRPLLGAGISYGYLLPFNEHWAGEFTLGAGYANMRYDTYYNMDNGARIDTRTKNYWGITRVGLSVVYRFNLKK
jgi:hypothetical protein